MSDPLGSQVPGPRRQKRASGRAHRGHAHNTEVAKAMTRRQFVRAMGLSAVGGTLAGVMAQQAEGHAMTSGAGHLKVVRKGAAYDSGPGIISGVCRCKNGDLLVAFNTGGDSSPGQRT